MGEGGRSRESQTTYIVSRSDDKDLDRAELGVVPWGAIHVRNEISLRDDRR